MAELGEDILQQLGDGSGIVLQGGGDIEMHQGDETQHLVEEIIGGDGSYQEGGEVSVDNVHDLITLHSGDGDNQMQPDDLSAMESMMDTGDIVEEVIASQGQGNARGQQQQTFLNMAESVFNPATGTLQPVSQMNSTPTAGTSAQLVKHITPKKTPQKQVKFIIAQPNQQGEGGQGPLLLDAAQLQSLLSSGGASIVKTSSGQNIIIQAPKKAASATPIKSPAKILPAIVPSGDQQQQPTTSTPKVFMKQGGVLTPLTGGIPGGKVIQIGSGNQVRYVQLVPKKSAAPPNKIPIAPVKSKSVMARTQGGQTILLPAGDSALSGLGNLLVLPSGNILMKSESGTLRHSSGLNDSSEASILLGQQQAAAGQLEQFRSLLEPNGMRPRKPCNCTKSQCLKLYCDCFANGEFCHLCNCNGCSNNLAHEEERQKAIKLVLERNPGAFRPKIGKSSSTGEAHERRHNKGCNCRRSGCLKNYCECYEAKIFCSGICKCSGCKNCIENIPTNLPNGVGVEQHFAGAGTSHRQTLKDLAEAAEVRVQQQNQVRNKMRAQMQDFIPQNNLGVMVPPLIFRYPQGSISYEVVTSTVELLLAKAEAAERQKLSEGEMERIILEEFGECLSAVMELGSTVDNSSNAM